MSDQPASGSIREQIQAKQNELSDYLSYLEPFGTRLTYISIIGPAVAAILNVEVVRMLSQSTLSATSWVIPSVAALSSLAATTAAGIHKARVESRLPQFQKCAAEMEGLAALLDAHQLTEQAATKRFRKYVEECPPIPRRDKFKFDAIEGTIRQPVAGQAVGASFEASGTASNLGPGAYLWLTVELGDSLWPKEGRIVVSRDGRWSQQVFEDGVLDQFNLSLYSANTEADGLLRAWLDQGNRTHIFPEMRRPNGMRRLYRVGPLHRGP